ncbi:MAG TPA: GNAT family N-acetyltransferase [Candidatus Eremiobacteraceae bacterium]|nr:GNAT family N-acetyltransferase [Candidatus Eremiobacteraceae bacterium]
MTAADLPAADGIFRGAFAAYLGVDPQTFMRGRAMVQGRFGTNPAGAIVAHDGDKVVGSNMLANWGSFGFFGPLTVDPTRWKQGIAKRLMEETVARFDAWGTRHAALFTFADSTQHQALYQKFDFWPRFLTAIMHKVPSEPPAQTFSRFSRLDRNQRVSAVDEARDLCDDVLAGLDLGREIDGIAAQSLGDTILIRSGDRLEGIALCHFGGASEADERSFYVKFAAARPGQNAQSNFIALIGACESLAVENGLTDIEIGVSTETVEAYRTLIGLGFKPAHFGVFMLRGVGSAIYRPDRYVIADLR